MRPVIEKGYLYIAQPPLYKAKIGKKEQYLKDDKAFKQFLFDWAREQVTLFANEKEIPASQWQTILKTLSTYDDQLDKTSINFKVAYEHAHQLITILAKHSWKIADGFEKLIAILQKALPAYQISLESLTLPDVAIDTPAAHTMVALKYSTKNGALLLISLVAQKLPIYLNYYIS